ncbi:coiled-coil domain-containing protein [Pontibacillus litoralis]|uniref:Uncharacterized protein n=1 Tax=Pontibacillus litoralis JSM 072002 TaxID=1385512 RepID=A0A0A5G205_9BACI|nr:hypothetical protein [Pontibacillus litoralis]KGX85173.1 hypothetical protein N784_09765 [Pontibacillus litoralis JSM 072002]
MFLIAYKKGPNPNVEKSKIIFDRPLTFTDANDMFNELVQKYKQTGQSIKIGYKIIQLETGESVFNSKLIIDHDILSIFKAITDNKNTPKNVVEYITRVENREIIESDEANYVNDHIEEKAHLNSLKEEKNNILQQLKNDEKDRKQRELEFQNEIKAIQEEKKKIEQSLQMKEKEEVVKETERIEDLRLKEEEKNKVTQKMEEKRLLDKKKQEEHQQRLKEVESAVRKAEIELQSIESELEKKNLLRKKELQELEEKKAEAERKMNILKAEGEKEDIQYQGALLEMSASQDNSQEMTDTFAQASVMPKTSLKEKLQELDFEQVKKGSIHFLKSGAKASVNGFKKAKEMFEEYKYRRISQKEEKLKHINKQAELDEKIAKQKMKLMEELKKEHKKEAKRKEQEASKQLRIESRYRAAVKRKGGRYPMYNNGSLKFIFGIVTITVIGIGCIYYFDMGSKYPVLNDLKNTIDQFIS